MEQSHSQPSPRTAIVLKIGTSSLTDPNGPVGGGLRLSIMAALVEEIVRLRRQGRPVILVSSGAVGVGCARLGLKQRPATIAEKQAVAAVGQGRLMRIYDDLFSSLDQPIAQVLLTRADLVDRGRYLNARHTFEQLLQMGVIPIVNENDTVATEELRFGDNDSLSALVASMVEAAWLILLTDVDRLYSADPNQDPLAKPIERVTRGMPLLVQAGSQGKSGWGTGGMATKLTAAQIATSAGVTTVITSSRHPDKIAAILAGESVGTRFDPDPEPARARKRWIAYGLLPEGSLGLDAGAVRAVCEQGRSLLPAGIVTVTGSFEEGAAVSLMDPGGREVGRGLVNYGSDEIQQLRGKRTTDIAATVGYRGVDTIIHRDNLALLE
ncbi:MAG: glutamate 5-kinase [Cyanophyceae cyanobacterium]